MRWINQLKATLTGQQAEQRAREFLVKQGLSFVTANYHCRQGEIDLIMRQGEQWIFVEVKYRRQSQHGHPAEYFDRRKRQKVEAAIAHYLHYHQLNPANLAMRIDVIAMQGDAIDWLKGV